MENNTNSVQIIIIINFILEASKCKAKQRFHRYVLREIIDGPNTP